MPTNPLTRLLHLGQSVWLDYIRRDFIQGGDLAALIREDGLRGVTSNPAIFEKAIAASELYDDAIRDLARASKTALEIYEAIAIDDVGRAADLFRETWEASDGQDGFVSLEVSPLLAHDTEGTIAEARRLHAWLDRPNVHIKVPATAAGVPAIRQLLIDGIPINVTLLFDVERYRQVAEAFIEALEVRVDGGESVERSASVASFFLSRIDVLVDGQIDAELAGGSEKGDEARRLKSLRGEIAIASARDAYALFRELFQGPRFEKLRRKGASPQRLLWASTSTKDPSYPDVKYVEALIAPETVTTLPPSTLDAYRDHGEPENRLERQIPDAQALLALFESSGFSLSDVSKQLEAEGVEKFVKPFEKLLATIDEQKAALT